MRHSCTQLECTVAATGTCLLLHKPLSACPNYTEIDSPLSEGSGVEPADGSKTAEGKEVARRFFSGFELGTTDATEIMRAEYGTLIAVLGLYDVGKTCFLA